MLRVRKLLLHLESRVKDFPPTCSRNFLRIQRCEVFDLIINFGDLLLELLDLLLQLQLLLHNLLHLNKDMVKLTTNFKIPVPVSAVRQNNNFNCVQLYISLTLC